MTLGLALEAVAARPGVEWQVLCPQHAIKSKALDGLIVTPLRRFVRRPAS
jgi:hypothetical protein